MRQTERGVATGASAGATTSARAEVTTSDRAETIGPRAALPVDPLAPEPGWPRWLESGPHRTDQTSGLAFVGRDSAGARVFLAADDVGALWRLRVIGAHDSLDLAAIRIEGPAADTLARFPKIDIEEITICPVSSRVFISIEGNAPKNAPPDSPFRDALGIFEVVIEPDLLHARRATAVTRVALPEWDAASRLAARNVGFEAGTVCGDTLLLGLEGISPGEGIFADSTVLQLFDTARGTRVEFGTSDLDVMTVTGFARAQDGRIFGIDRNRSRLFSFRIRRGAIVEYQTVPLALPGVRGVPYSIPSIEAVAVDDDRSVWVVVDPWKYEPLTQEGLSEHDRANYKNKVPLLYKYRDPFVVGGIANGDTQ